MGTNDDCFYDKETSNQPFCWKSIVENWTESIDDEQMLITKVSIIKSVHKIA